jgi:hypothetical protein
VSFLVRGSECSSRPVCTLDLVSPYVLQVVSQWLIVSDLLFTSVVLLAARLKRVHGSLHCSRDSFQLDVCDVSACMFLSGDFNSVCRVEAWFLITSSHAGPSRFSTQICTSDCCLRVKQALPPPPDLGTPTKKRHIASSRPETLMKATAPQTHTIVFYMFFC